MYIYIQSNGVCIGTVCASVDTLDISGLLPEKVPYTPRYLLKKQVTVLIWTFSFCCVIWLYLTLFIFAVLSIFCLLKFIPITVYGVGLYWNHFVLSISQSIRSVCFHCVYSINLVLIERFSPNLIKNVHLNKAICRTFISLDHTWRSGIRHY